MRIDFGQFCDALVPAFGRVPLTDREAGQVFRATMASLVRFDHVVVFAYRGKARPLDLFSTFDGDAYHIFVTLYQAGAFLLDPFYHTAHARRAGVFRMKELAPDRFFSSEYFRSYYSQTRLAEEVGFFVPLEGDVSVVLSLMRSEGTGPFPAAEFALLDSAASLVSAFVARTFADLSARFDAAEGRGSRRATGHAGADSVWRRLNLTDREAAIIDLVLQGHSSESIGLKLAISTGTVKVHRRNVYRKLGISSQIQLLSLYLKTLEH